MSMIYGRKKEERKVKLTLDELYILISENASAIHRALHIQYDDHGHELPLEPDFSVLLKAAERLTLLVHEARAEAEKQGIL